MTVEAAASYSKTSSPSPTPAPAPATTQAAAPLISIGVTVGGGDSSLPTIEVGVGNGPFTDGFATFYNQEGGTGACGQAHSDSDLIVAIQIDRYGTGSNNAPDCGRTVVITNPANSKTVVAKVAGRLPLLK